MIQLQNSIFDKDCPSFCWMPHFISYNFWVFFSKINVPKDNPMPNNNPHPSPWEVDLRMVQNGHKLFKHDGSIVVLVDLLIYLLEKSGYECTAHPQKKICTKEIDKTMTKQVFLVIQDGHWALSRQDYSTTSCPIIGASGQRSSIINVQPIGRTDPCSTS